MIYKSVVSHERCLVAEKSGTGMGPRRKNWRERRFTGVGDKGTTIPWADKRTHRRSAFYTKGRSYICSDRRVALAILQSMTGKSKLTPKCHNTLNNMAKDRVVELLWIPSHSGRKDNEKMTRTRAGQPIMGSAAVSISYTQSGYMSAFIKKLCFKVRFIIKQVIKMSINFTFQFLKKGKYKNRRHICPALYIKPKTMI